MLGLSLLTHEISLSTNISPYDLWVEACVPPLLKGDLHEEDDTLCNSVRQTLKNSTL